MEAALRTPGGISGEQGETAGGMRHSARREHTRVHMCVGAVTALPQSLCLLFTPNLDVDVGLRPSGSQLRPHRISD